MILGTSKLKPMDPTKAVSISVRDIIMHPKYWGRTFTMGDIALLLLHTPVVFSKYVQPICLPEPTYNLKVGTQCWVTGWGQVKQRFSGEQDGMGRGWCGSTEGTVCSSSGASPAGPPSGCLSGSSCCNLCPWLLDALGLPLTWEPLSWFTRLCLLRAPHAGLAMPGLHVIVCLPKAQSQGFINSLTYLFMRQTSSIFHTRNPWPWGHMSCLQGV